ncbi:MAG: LacI family DNA-binding transcriptional regulator [Armatimonadota bacterium]
MVSIRQLAKLAGVAPVTVCRVLHGERYVRPEIRQRVQELADLYHYHPNRLAQGVFSGKSGLLGLVLGDITHPYNVRVLKSVLETAFEHGYRVIPLETHEPDHTRKALMTLIELQVEGILIGSYDFDQVPRELVLSLRSHNVRYVVADRYFGKRPVDHIAIDEQQIGELAVDYLHCLGHRKIVYLGPFWENPLPASVNRATAVREALERRGLPLLHYDSMPVEELEKLIIGLAEDMSTAMICWDDAKAAEVIQVCTAHQIRIPHDVSVIGCGNHVFGSLLTPPLTTIEQYPDEMARAATELLIRRVVQGEEPGAGELERRLIAPTLIERASCGTASAG